MPISESKRRNNDKYNAKCMQLNIKPLIPEGEAIKAAAAAAGESTQGYILTAVRQRMERDASSAPDSPAEALPPDVENMLE